MNKEIKFNQDVFDEKKVNSKSKSVWSKVFLVIFIVYIVLFVVFMAGYLSFKSRFSCVPVTGRSMQPTINASVVAGDPNNEEQEADWVYIEKRQLKYGDIVVFDAKEYNGSSLCLIKRVVAFEGDAVTIIKKDNPNYDKPVYTICRIKAENLVDGSIDDGDVEVLEEDYTTDVYDWTYKSLYSGVDPLYEDAFKYTFFTNPNNHYETLLDKNGVQYAIIPQGEFFYMADNRGEGSDSRHRGTDYISSVRGAVEIHVKDAAHSSSALLVQCREVLSYYGRIIGNFFSDLWFDLERAFDI